MSYRVMGLMEDGQYHCFAAGFSDEASALLWCQANDGQYPETRLFPERAPTARDVLYGFYDHESDEGEL